MFDWGRTTWREGHVWMCHISVSDYSPFPRDANEFSLINDPESDATVSHISHCRFIQFWSSRLTTSASQMHISAYKCPLSKLWKPNVHPAVIYSCSPLIRVTGRKLRPWTEQQSGHTPLTHTHVKSWFHQQSSGWPLDPKMLLRTKERKKEGKKEGNFWLLHALTFTQTMKEGVWIQELDPFLIAGHYYCY